MSNFVRLAVPRQQGMAAHSIVVNATNTPFAIDSSHSLYIKPIRAQSGFSQSLYYNPTSGEIVYADVSGGAGGGGGDSLWKTNQGGDFLEPSGTLVKGVMLKSTPVFGNGVGGFMAAGFLNTANGSSSVAMGGENNAGGNYAFSAGYLCSASGTYSVALGYASKAMTQCDHALGNANTASGGSSTAIGASNDATQSYAVAMGYDNESSGSAATAIGQANTASADSAVALGYNNTASGTRSVAIGNTNTSSGEGSVALGQTCISTATGSFAAGYQSSAGSAGAVAIGQDCSTNAPWQVALGKSAYTTSNEPFMFADGSGSTYWAFGYDASGPGVFVNGNRVSAGGGGGAGLWQNLNATTLESISATITGIELDGTIIRGSSNYAFMGGNNNNAPGECSIALGCNNDANGDYQIALGKDASTNDIEPFIFADGSGTNRWALGYDGSGTGALLHNGNSIASATLATQIINNTTNITNIAANANLWKKVGNHLEPSGNDISGINLPGHEVFLNNTIILGTDNSGIMIGGDGNTATGDYSVAIGFNCNANGDYQVALGKNANTSDTRPLVFCDGSGANCWAFGYDSSGEGAVLFNGQPIAGGGGGGGSGNPAAQISQAIESPVYVPDSSGASSQPINIFAAARDTNGIVLAGTGITYTNPSPVDGVTDGSGQFSIDSGYDGIFVISLNLHLRVQFLEDASCNIRIVKGTTYGGTLIHEVACGLAGVTNFHGGLEQTISCAADLVGGDIVTFWLDNKYPTTIIADTGTTATFFKAGGGSGGSSLWKKVGNHLEPNGTDISGINLPGHEVFLNNTIILGTDNSGIVIGGDGNTATGDYAAAIGYNCNAIGDYSLAMGFDCVANDEYNIALGNQADASGTCGFIYRDVFNNTFCFDSGGSAGSGKLLINGQEISSGDSGIVGTIMPFAGPSGADLGDNWLFCDGSEYARSLYPDLSNALGTTYGGDATNFNVPDLRGRTLYGELAGEPASANRSSLASFNTDISGVVGDASMSALQMPSHSHSMGTEQFLRNTGAGATAGGGANSFLELPDTDPSGGNQDYLPPAVLVNFIIRCKTGASSGASSTSSKISQTIANPGYTPDSSGVSTSAINVFAAQPAASGVVLAGEGISYSNANPVSSAADLSGQFIIAAANSGTFSITLNLHLRVPVLKDASCNVRIVKGTTYGGTLIHEVACGLAGAANFSGGLEQTISCVADLAGGDIVTFWLDNKYPTNIIADKGTTATFFKIGNIAGSGGGGGSSGGGGSGGRLMVLGSKVSYDTAANVNAVFNGPFSNSLVDGGLGSNTSAPGLVRGSFPSWNDLDGPTQFKITLIGAGGGGNGVVLPAINRGSGGGAAVAYIDCSNETTYNYYFNDSNCQIQLATQGQCTCPGVGTRYATDLSGCSYIWAADGSGASTFSWQGTYDVSMGEQAWLFAQCGGDVLDTSGAGVGYIDISYSAGRAPNPDVVGFGYVGENKLALSNGAMPAFNGLGSWMTDTTAGNGNGGIGGGWYGSGGRSGLLIEWWPSAAGSGGDSSGTAVIVAGTGTKSSLRKDANNDAAGLYSVALGGNNYATPQGSIAIGMDCSALGVSSIAMGGESTATSSFGISMGNKNVASGNYAVAMGYDCSATGTYCIAMGCSNRADWVPWGGPCAGASIAMGGLNRARNNFDIAMGYLNDCCGGSAVCLGQQNTITDGGGGGGGGGVSQSAVAIGRGNHAAGSYSVAMGKSCIARGPGYTDRGCCVAMGYECDASAIFNDGWLFNVGGAVAMGAKCRAYGGASFAAGYDCSAQGDFSVAMGYRCDASKDNSIALGRENLTTGFGSTALGGYCEASGTYSLVQGLQSKALGYNSVAMGKDCRAEGDYSVAMGRDCSASGIGAFSMGQGCVADGSGSFAAGINCHTETAGAVTYGVGAIAMGRTCTATGWGAISMGNESAATGACGVALGQSCTASSASVALGAASKAYAFNSVAIGEGNETNGWASVAMGSTCKTDTSYNIALGKSADASGTGGFVYRSNAGNTFVFDDGPSPSLKINGSAVGSAAALSFRVVYSISGQISISATLNAITTTFPSLPNDNRLVSVTAWTAGNGTYCGGGVTFNIPSSEFRTWYWGFDAAGYNLNLWSNSSSSNTNQANDGFFWNSYGGAGLSAGSCQAATGGVGGAIDVRYWNQIGQTGGTGAAGAMKVPGAAANAGTGAQLSSATILMAGIKIQWIG